MSHWELRARSSGFSVRGAFSIVGLGALCGVVWSPRLELVNGIGLDWTLDMGSKKVLIGHAFFVLLFSGVLLHIIFVWSWGWSSQVSRRSKLTG